jgi:dGTP triphosphohydrolase
MTTQADPRLIEVQDRILEQANRKDYGLQQVADQKVRSGDLTIPIFTRNSVAERLKGDSLVTKNKEETNWPGPRAHYDIDRDLILFNPSFVRMARKAQVFIGQSNTAIRSRLMHTLEVSQIARSVAIRWGLNEDLVEAICLGHDIGQPPFGHSGEHCLNDCMFEFFVRQYGLDMALPPPVLSLREGRKDPQFDATLFLVIEGILDKHALPEFKKANRIRLLLGESRYDTLLSKNIIELYDTNGITLCKFTPPLSWKIADEGKRIMREFWLQSDDVFIFSHFTHSLRVLLCDMRRPRSDITKQTAYGIISHSWRGPYQDFIFELPDGTQTSLSSSDHETPEAFVVRVADDICFTNSDLDDVDHANLLRWEAFSEDQQIALWKLTGMTTTYDKGYPPTSAILNWLENGFEFKNGFSKSIKDKQIHYMKERNDALEAARGIIMQRVHPLLAPRRNAARAILRDLFLFFNSSTRTREVELLTYGKFESFWRAFEGDNSVSGVRKVIDFLAYLTDDEAIAIHSALFAPEHDHWATYFFGTRYDH